jgi:GTP-binding protein HflX
MEKDMLFATLGTSVRNVKLPNNQQILLIDTVGFVSKLPTTLINSFRSTLEEINNSALIIHVVDSSSPHCKDQIDVTNKVLEEIGVKNSKELYLLNKADKGIDEHFFINKDHLKFSNKNGLNHDKLITLIQESVLDYSNTLLDLNIPISDGKAISIVEGYGIIEAKFISNEYIYYKAYIPNNLINNLKQYYYFKTNNPKPF